MSIALRHFAEQFAAFMLIYLGLRGSRQDWAGGMARTISARRHAKPRRAPGRGWCEYRGVVFALLRTAQIMG
jgi:hypothetical protein